MRLTLVKTYPHTHSFRLVSRFLSAAVTCHRCSEDVDANIWSYSARLNRKNLAHGERDRQVRGQTTGASVMCKHFSYSVVIDETATFLLLTLISIGISISVGLG